VYFSRKPSNVQCNSLIPLASAMLCRLPCPKATRSVYWRSLLNPPGGDMESTSQYPKWVPYEIKAASVLYERRSEDLQLEQLRVRLQKKMQEAEARAAEPTAA
jgi:hypothetical protein